MSVTSAMQAGVSGLLTNGEAISVIGNNLANVSTTGFKEGKTLFSDLLSTSINNGQIGCGSQVQGVQNVFSQGTLVSTGSATDLAIQGDAMFVLQGANSTQQYYSRAGSFAFNNNSILTDPSGNEVLGYGMSNMITGTSNGVLGTIDLANFSTMAPKATGTLSLSANLDSASSPPAATWDPSQANFDPTAASNFSTSATVYDAQGDAKSLTMYFANTGANTWDLYTYDGTNYTAAGAGTQLTFDPSSGALTNPNPATISTNGMTVDLTGTTQFATASSVSSQTQDGYAAGNETGVSIDSKGVVNVQYSNSQIQKIAQVALATFASPTGLESMGGNLYSATTTSGAALINNTSNLSNNTIASSSLEQSNVDLGDQLTQLITVQQAYEANSKTITTADEMMQDVLNVIK
jgi:flagellar hook protein FlgE